MKNPVILCVDDEKIILDSLEEQILNRLGNDFDVELAESGEEALEIIEELDSEGRELAVVVSDQLMPGMKGDEFLIKVHQTHPQTVKILLTGQASLDAVQNAINHARLYRYVNKPWEENDLMLTIEEAARSYLQYLQLLEYNRLLRSLNKAAQELSGEIQISRLIQKLMNNAIQNANAEVGYLLLQKDSKLSIEAFASTLKEEAGKLQELIKEHPELVTKELLQKIGELLNSPNNKDYRFVTPLMKKNKVLGYLYLENPRSHEVFSSIQREVLQMLAAQAAISLENANLYKSLEEKTLELQKEKEHVEQQNKVIAQKNKDIEESLIYAKRIQLAIMPPVEVLKKSFPDSFVFYRPKEIVSGDFYWFFEKELKNEDTGKISRYLFIAAVDCTGHGVPGAFMSVLGSNLLNQLVSEFSLIEPEVILSYLDFRVKDALKTHGVEGTLVKDGMDIALCCYDFQNRVLRFAGAQRPLYYVRNGELHILKGTKRPIGGQLYGVGEEPPFEVHEIPLQNGDAIYIFTDGIIDQFGGPENKKLSTRRFQEIILAIHQYPMEEQAQYLAEAFEKWKDHEGRGIEMGEQTDDVLIIGFRYQESNASN